MGLDVSHDCFSGAYSAFNRWRNELARVAEYAFANYDGIEAPSIDWGHISEKNIMGYWKKLPDDPLVILIAHSDCEGIIQHSHARALANRLSELIDKLPDTPDPGHIGVWRDKTQAFIDGLKLAAKKKQNVKFG